MISRRNFFTKSSLGSLALIAGASSSNAKNKDSATDTKSQFSTSFPVVMAPRHDGCEIIWSVTKLSKGHIEYGTTKELGSKASNDGWGLRPAGDKVIKIRIDGLKPGTKYFYKAVTESFDTKNPNPKDSAVYSFRTLDPKSDNCSFSVWNDTHKHKDTLDKLSDITKPCDFLLWNGDICNDWHNEQDVINTLLKPADGLTMSINHPLFLVRGNHDIRGAYATKLQEYCAMPEGKPWYAFKQGPVAAICLDTGEDKSDDNPYLFGRVACEPMRQEQAEWLAKIIETPEFKDAPYRVVFCHIPLRWTNETAERSYDSYSGRSRDLWHDSFVKWGAQTIISGHMHQDALIQSNAEFPYAQLVGGGPKMNSATLIEGKADKDKLHITCKNLEGKTLHELSLKPVQ